MATVRNDHVLAAALALLLTTAGTALAAPENPGTVASAQPSDAELNSRIPLPEPLNVPPPSAKDVAAPAPEQAMPAQPAEAAAPQPVVTSAPQPAVTPSVPEPAATASLPQPAVASAPEPVAPAAPEPAVTSAPPPAVTSTPEPVVTSAPEPVAPAAPEPAVTSAPAPATTDTATAPTAVEAPVDPVATKLKEIITTKLSRFVDRKDDRPGVESFYAARQYAPLWTDQGVVNARGKAVIAYLAGVSAEGLDPSDYPAPAFKAGADPQALAEAELKLVDSVVTFARHAQNGRVHFSRVAADISYNLAPPDPAQVLEKLAEASDAKSLDSYAPQHAGYKALKAKLAELRGQTAEPAATPAPQTVRVPEGPILRFGDDDRRVPFLRKRLELADQTSTKYDKQVVEAVKEFQEKAGLNDDGSVGPATLRVLNGGNVAAKPRGRNDTISIVLANMERWRWMPRELGKAHVVLNVPSFMLKVVNNGTKVWETRVVVGKPNTATPMLSDTMKFITVNPTWNVPPSIVYGEYLPVLQQDPTAMSRIGLKVTQNNDGTIHMYQPPGDRNALGRIRFNFPNKFLVYQHDTPDKHLFARETRAYSHGCMRVQDPLKYGEVLLSIALPNQNYTAAKLRSMYGPEERDIQFPVPIPVHITYQTAYVEDGKLVLKDDIYGRDARVLALLKGEDRRIADIPQDRRAEQNASYQRSPVNLPYGVLDGGESSRYSYRDGGGGFFGMLFGGPRYYPQQRPAAQVDRRRTNSRPLN